MKIPVIEYFNIFLLKIENFSTASYVISRTKIELKSSKWIMLTNEPLLMVWDGFSTTVSSFLVWSIRTNKLKKLKLHYKP